MLSLFNECDFIKKKKTHYDNSVHQMNEVLESANFEPFQPLYKEKSLNHSCFIMLVDE